jgi:3-oxoadipate enol-lactonase
VTTQPSRTDSVTSLGDGSSLAYTLRPGPTADAPRFVLIHSLALDRSIWDGVVAQLEGEAALLTYDCRGHGQSDRRAMTYSAELFADDLAQLLDHVGWSSAIVGGCSMGGCVALAFAARYPNRTEALGLIDTTAWYGADAPEKFKERADAAKAKGMAALFGFQSTRWFSDEFRASHPDVLKKTLEVFKRADLACYAASCDLLGSVDVRGHLAGFQMPVAVVVGEEDYATPVEMARLLYEATPQSSFTVLPHARHLTPIEHPGPIASELRTLAQRVSASHA